MIASGIAVDISTCLAIKRQLAHTVGFQDESLAPSQTGHGLYIRSEEAITIPVEAYPCISELMLLIDAPHVLKPRVAAAGAAGVTNAGAAPLVGSVFADIPISVLGATSDLSTVPVPVVKALLETVGTWLTIIRCKFLVNYLLHQEY